MSFFPKDKDTAAGDGVQLDEHEHLVHDIAAINPDVFCVKQAHVDYAALHLRPELSRCVHPYFLHLLLWCLVLTSQFIPFQTRLPMLWRYGWYSRLLPVFHLL